MTLGHAFNRRKKLAADLQTWIGRLQAAGFGLPFSFTPLP
jgi:hypothetical protein